MKYSGRPVRLRCWPSALISSGNDLATVVRCLDPFIPEVIMRQIVRGILPAVAGMTIVLLFATRLAGQGQPLLYTVPFKAGDGRYLIYRIPALWTAPDKPLLAFAEGRV